MAGRKTICNLRYFPLEVGFFDDHKIISIEEEFSIKGGYLAVRLLAMVYSDKGYYMEWPDKFEFTIAKRVGNNFTGALVSEIFKCCIKHDLFSKEMFEKYKIVTSKGIQERWQNVMIGLRRKVEYEEKFWLITSEDKVISSEEIAKDVTGNGTPAAEITQKGIEVNGNELNTSASAPPQPRVGTGKKEETTPHWEALVDIWFRFNQDQFGDKPSFKGADPKNLKKILCILEKRATGSKVEWTEPEAILRFTAFLQAAFDDEWMSKNFLLSNLEKFFDKIILNQIAKTNGHGKNRKNNLNQPAIQPAVVNTSENWGR